jgi:hypothetical protein
MIRNASLQRVVHWRGGIQGRAGGHDWQHELHRGFDAVDIKADSAPPHHTATWKSCNLLETPATIEASSITLVFSRGTNLLHMWDEQLKPSTRHFQTSCAMIGAEPVVCGS